MQTMFKHECYYLKYFWLREKSRQIYQDIKNFILRIKKNLFSRRLGYQPIPRKYEFTWPTYECCTCSAAKEERDETD